MESSFSDGPAPPPCHHDFKTVRVRVACLQVNQLLSERLFFFSKSNRISLLTYYLREKSALRRCLSEKQLNGYFSFIEI